MTNHTIKQRIIDVHQTVNFLEDCLGATWLKDNLKKIKNAQGGMVNFGCGINESTAIQDVARLAYWWYRAQEEISMAYISGQKYPGYFSLLAAVVGSDLQTLQQCQGFSKKIDQLKQHYLSEQVIFELSIAAGYARAGHDLVFAEHGFNINNNHALNDSMVITIASDDIPPIVAITANYQRPFILYLQPNVYALNCQWDDQKQKQWYAALKTLPQSIPQNCGAIITCFTSLVEFSDRHQLIQDSSSWHQLKNNYFDLYLPAVSIIPNGTSII